MSSSMKGLISGIIVLAVLGGIFPKRLITPKKVQVFPTASKKQKKACSMMKVLRALKV